MNDSSAKPCDGGHAKLLNKPTDTAMSSEDKLLFVSRQMDALPVEADANALQCPYCGSVTIEGESFCCPTMMAAITVLLDARDKIRAMQRSIYN